MSWNSSTQVMTAPVGLGDIAQAVGVTTQDLGTLIKSMFVNKWARYKPIRSSQVGYVTLAQRKDNGNGFGSVSSLAWSVIQNNQMPDSFEYLKPRGKAGGDQGADEWYRVFDFCHIETDLSGIGTYAGYNHNAAPALDWYLHIDGMSDAKTLSVNTFYFNLTNLKVRAKYRIGNNVSFGSANNIEIPLDELKFSGISNIGTDVKLCVTNYKDGALHDAVAAQPLNVLTDAGSGVGFEIPLSSVMPGGGGAVWPQDASDNGYSFYPRLRAANTSTYWCGIETNALRLIPYLLNPIAMTYNGSIAFYDGAPDSGGTLLASFQPDGDAVKITSTGQSGTTVTWTSDNLYIRFYSIYLTNSESAGSVGLEIPGAGGVQFTPDPTTRTSIGKTYNSQVPASYGSFSVPASGNYTIGGMGKYIDFSFGAQTITFTSGGGSATDKRASFPCPQINMNATGGLFAYLSGQRLYYY